MMPARSDDRRRRPLSRLPQTSSDASTPGLLALLDHGY
jgi:hypothetical protein